MNIKKVGLTALAASLVSVSANAGAISVAGGASINYSGGIIITDWYSENSSPNESLKISIRFLTNEIRSDALDIKIFNRQCTTNFMNCNISEVSGNLVTELKKEILGRATRYKNNKSTDYSYPDLKDLTKD